MYLKIQGGPAAAGKTFEDQRRQRWHKDPQNKGHGNLKKKKKLVKEKENIHTLKDKDHEQPGKRPRVNDENGDVKNFEEKSHENLKKKNPELLVKKRWDIYLA